MKRSTTAAISGSGVNEGSFEEAVVSTVAYADVFDYPLTPVEVHRYLIARPASSEHVERALGNGHLVPGRLSQRWGYFMLPGRERTADLRRARSQRVEQLWQKAYHWGKLIAYLPFVRMVAVTGSLAVNNADEQADIDYLVVTVPERLWLCRAMMILLVRYAERSGDILCPNYILSEQALSMERQDLFMARELVQMVPLYGIETYQQMREVNAWSDRYLPNAHGPPSNLDAPDVVTIPKLWRPLRATLEAILKTRLGTKLEQWEMDRKIRKFKQLYPDHSEAGFSKHWCKGHFEGHGSRIMSAFTDRLQSVDEETS